MERIAILIDGGYFLKRLPSAQKDVDRTDPAQVDKALGLLIWNHLEHINKRIEAPSPFSLLYRCFYYDANPYDKKGHKPVSKNAIDYSKTPKAKFRRDLFKLLRKRPNLALRLGEVRRERAWIIDEHAQKELLNGTRTATELTDDDFQPGFRQKAVDIRIGCDIATLTLKKQVSTIILVAGDEDFVPAAKLARREGVRIILDPLWRSVAPDLFEHIDSLRSGFSRPEGANNVIQS